MSRNIEIKAEISPAQQQMAIAVAGELATQPPAILHQKDTFFCVPTKRLKLRQFGDGTAELIAYDRIDCEQPVPSNYYRALVTDPDELLAGLSLVLGVRGVIEKTRRLFLVEQTRIHIDEVQDLGNFLELEVVMHDGQAENQGIEIAQQLMLRLGIENSQLVSNAYIDLLEKRNVTVD